MSLLHKQACCSSAAATCRSVPARLAAPSPRFSRFSSSPRLLRSREASQGSARPSVQARGLLDNIKRSLGAGEGLGQEKGQNERPSIENMGIDYYDRDEVEHYFNYMGCLATEGTYDRMYQLLDMHHPAHVILLLASQENDEPKIQELLTAGVDVGVKDQNGKTPMDLATKPEVKDLMKDYAAKKSSQPSS